MYWRSSIFVFYFNIVYICVNFSRFCKADDILGCNGFIKSDIDINFSKIEIKLMTKQGTLKDQTECAPNNGYYFLPLYDKGEYILKVAAPAGWTFEPSEFVLNADGVTDHCSLNKDINFEFKGFSVHGKVVGIGEEKGPPGIKVSLKSKSGNVVETLSGQDGFFQFKPVLPSEYIIQVSHPKWRFHKSEDKVKVVSDNAEVPPGSLVISGYDVTGIVTSDNEPVQDVHFVAFAEKNQKVVKHGCDTAELNSFPMPAQLRDKTPVCYVRSNEEGLFLFPSLSPGQYTLVPFYQKQSNVKFDIQPAVLNFIVAQDSVILDVPFQIMGFSVHGRVLSSRGGSPVSNAVILIDDREVARSMANGNFVLESMRTGTYRLGVKSENMRFNDIEVKASPSSTQLDAIHPAAYKVCGTVQAAASSSLSNNPEPPRLVVFTSKSSNGDVVFEETWSKEGSGDFCLFLSPNKYNASISISDIDRQKGLQFAPLKREVIVKDSTVNNINFSQLRAELKGSIQCLDSKSCPEFLVHLRNIATDQTVHDVVVTNGFYSVSNILPGEYEIILQNGPEFCWEKETLRVTIDALVAQAPPFKQTGVSISFVSSHSTKVHYRTETKNPADKIIGEFNLSEGVTSTCVPKNAQYVFTPIGCHGYADAQIQWKLGQGSVSLSAITHQLTSKLVTDRAVNDLVVNVLNTQGKLINKIGPLKLKRSHPSRNMFEYEFDIQLSPHDQITVVPTAQLLLFSPQSISYIGQNDCQVADEFFTAETGKLIEGSIKPPLSDVLVKVFNDVGVEVYHSKTSNDGKYKFGPCRINERYIVTAEKEGYILKAIDQQGNFNAHKLAEVIVTIKDKADNTSLSGVLISLSGGESYRRNAQTGADGKVSFMSLSPNEYYLRPMMKEYKFTPSSQIIKVEEAATAQVEWSGVRIAYSVLGSVNSLNREPEPGVTVEAVGVPDSGLDCEQLQEESVTELNGQFRIRGLKPQCDYTVRVKNSPGVNQHIERTTPTGIPVKVSTKDITLSKRFIAFRPVSKCDLTVFIESKHLKTLTIKLYKSRSHDNPIHVLKLKSLQNVGEHSIVIPLMHLPITSESKTYSVVLETSLNKNIYDLQSEKLVQEFHADASYKLVAFNFNPQLITVNEHVLNDINNVLLCIIIAIIVAVVVSLNNYKTLHLYVQNMKESINKIRERETLKGERERERENDGSVLMEAIPIIKRKTKTKKIS